MALSDITGFFSRYFVVGFFLPAFASLIAFRLAANADSVPNELASRPEAAELLILGGAAVFVGLALSGGSYYITRLFSDPLYGLSGWRVVGRLRQFTLLPERRRFLQLLGIRDDNTRPNTERATAALILDRFFPRSEDALLATRVGNTLRAWDRHANVRWGLDGITIWPRIEMLLSAEERHVLVEAKIDFYVFLNAAFGALVVGACLIIDEAVNAPRFTVHWLDAIPFVLGFGFYRASIGPATAWGDVVRSSIDLHRLEMYEKLGLRAPRSFTDERELADKVNKHLLYGHPLLKDELWRGTEVEEARVR